jgi:dienelactone hydrolase
VKARGSALAMAVLVFAACACGSARPASTASALLPDPYHAYTRPGPWAAGVALLANGPERVVVWYPADPASARGRPHYSYRVRSWLPPQVAARVPAGVHDSVETEAYLGVPASRAGRFPVVLFSHGYGGFPEQSSFLTAHLATWGFVVAAPDHVSRDLAAAIQGPPPAAPTDVEDLQATISWLDSQDADPASPLYRRLDLGRLATLGHSAGGGAVVDLAASDQRVRAFVSMAGVTDVSLPRKGLPGLLLAGAQDMAVPASQVASLYDLLPPPKRLVVIGQSGHNAFADTCSIGADQGGPVAISQRLGLPIPASLLRLAADGCNPPDVSPTVVYPLIRHTVVAQLRWALRIDPRPVGLGDGLARAYPATAVTYRHSP